jgi:voltage-gated potassium channel
MILLALLLISAGVMPHLELTLVAGTFDLVSSSALLLLFAGVLIASSIAVSPTRKTQRLAIAMAAAVILAQVLGMTFRSMFFVVLMYVTAVAFLGFTIVMILRHLFHTRKVDSDVICASICAYLLIGVLWAFLYSLVELLGPGSFQDSVDRSIKHELTFSGRNSGRVLYFSFVTLSTLGYGDIVPRSPVAQTLAAVEAITGQLYLAVLVARLVGMHTAHTLARNEPQDDD